MPFCQNCGRALAAGEVCNCQPSPYLNQPGAPPSQGIPYPQNYQNVYQTGQQPPKQNKALIGCLIAGGIGLVSIPVLGILAAILVPAMLGYTAKANTSSANAAAKTCYKAASTALADLDAEDRLEPGVYIITNLPGKEDVNAPYDTAELHELFAQYYEVTADYFFVVEGTQVTYAAVCDDASHQTIGTYPRVCEPRKAVGYDGTELDVTSDSSNTFIEMFDDACRDIARIDLGDGEET